MFKRILVPLDGSEVAEGILPFVSAVARGLDVSLLLATVVDPSDVEVPSTSFRTTPRTHLGLPTGGPITVTGTASSEEPVVYRSQLEESAQDAARDSLRTVARRLAAEGVKVDVAASLGPAAEEIVRMAERDGCDLIAMSTHGRGTLGRAVLGSVTDRVIHSTTLPILTVTPERAKMKWDEGMGLSSVIVPLDGSELAESALPFAEALALALSLEIVLVRAVKTSGIYEMYTYYPYPGTDDMLAEVEQSAGDYLKDVGNRLRASGHDVRWRVLKGPHAGAIVEFARETPGDIVVLTTHGRSGLTRWALGSVAGALVRASGDPVLVIPSGQIEEAP